MSKYTTEVRFICEDYAGLTESGSYGTIESVIDRARPKLFDFYYPLYDPSYKRVLETKIIKHYYFREIGMETVGLFKFFLERKLNEIMPLFNKLYESELMVVNPLYTVNLTTKHEGNGKKGVDSKTEHSGSDISTNSGSIHKAGTNADVKSGSDTVTDEKTGSDTTSYTGSDTTETEARGLTKELDTRKVVNWDYYNDTPQGGISGIENLNYLTNARKTTSEVDGGNLMRVDESTPKSKTSFNSGNKQEYNSKNTHKSEYGSKDHHYIDETETDTRSTSITKGTKIDNNVEVNTTDEYIQKVTGFSGVSQNKLLKEYRENLLNIDMMIIDELSGLFMNLW